MPGFGLLSPPPAGGCGIIATVRNVHNWEISRATSTEEGSAGLGVLGVKRCQDEQPSPDSSPFPRGS